jgi:hypothetical protein
MKITTDNKRRDLVAWLDIPQQWRDTEGKSIYGDDLLDEDWDGYSPEWVKAYGTWRRPYDVQRIVSNQHPWAIGSVPVDHDSPLAAWTGIATESHFCGVVYKYIHDDDQVIVGWWTS